LLVIGLLGNELSEGLEWCQVSTVVLGLRDVGLGASCYGRGVGLASP